MADSLKLNINGVDIAANVPQWATETTLGNIGRALSHNNDLYEEITGKVMSMDNSAQAAAARAKGVGEASERLTNIAKRSIGDRITKATRSLSGILGKLSNTQKPISSTVNLAQDLPGAFGAVFPKMSKAMGEKFSGAMGGMSRYGDLAKKGGVAFTTWAGIAAGKFEQFSEVQQSMIDSGAVMYTNLSAFEELRMGAYDAGLAYEDLGKIVSNYGGAIQSLGSNISQGTSNFTRMIGELNDLGDQYGDWGMQSAQMAETYAGYIDAMRLTGTVNAQTVDAQDKLKKGFTDLMLETSALAAVTGENRNDIIKRRMSKLTDVEVAGAIDSLYDAGYKNQGDVLKALQTELADISPSLGPLGEKLTEALTTAAMRAADNPSTFDLNTALSNISPGLTARVEESVPGLIGKINNAMKTGELAEQGNVFRKAIMNADPSQYGSTSAQAGDEMFQFSKEVRIARLNLIKNEKKRAEMTDTEFKKVTNETARGLAESGKTVKVVNDATEMFFKAQAALLPDMDNMGEALTDVTDSLGNMKDWMEETFDKEDNQFNRNFFENLIGDTTDDQIDKLMKKATQGNANEEDWQQLALTLDQLETDRLKDSDSFFDNVQGYYREITSPFADMFNDIMGDGVMGKIWRNTVGLIPGFDSEGLEMLGVDGGEYRQQEGESSLLFELRKALDDKQTRFDEKTKNDPNYKPGDEATSGASFILIDGRPISPKDPMLPAQIEFLDQQWERAKKGGAEQAQKWRTTYPNWVIEKWLEARRFGGPVTGSRPYLVGEAGAEIFVPTESGYILNATDTDKILKAVEDLGIGGLNSVFAAARSGTTESLNNAIPYADATALNESYLGSAELQQMMAEAGPQFIEQLDFSNVDNKFANAFTSKFEKFADAIQMMQDMSTQGDVVQESGNDTEEELKNIRQIKESMLTSLRELRDLMRIENSNRDRRRMFSSGNI